MNLENFEVEVLIQKLAQEIGNIDLRMDSVVDKLKKMSEVNRIIAVNLLRT